MSKGRNRDETNHNDIITQRKSRGTFDLVVQFLKKSLLHRVSECVGRKGGARHLETSELEVGVDMP